MTLLDDIRCAIDFHAEAYAGEPEHITVEHEGDEFTATGSWWIEPSTDGQSDSNMPELPRHETRDLVLTGGLEQRVQAEFNRFKEGLETAPGTTLDTVALVDATYDEGIAATFDSDLAFISSLTGSLSVTSPPTEIIDPVIGCLRNLDPDAAESNVRETELLFSDRHVSRLVKVGGTVQTPNPHRYYNNVDSHEEYIETASELKDIDPETEMFEVYYSIRRDEGSIPSELVDFAENHILDVVTDTIDATVPFVLEAERLTYAPDDNAFAAFVHVPVEG